MKQCNNNHNCKACKKCKTKLDDKYLNNFIALTPVHLREEIVGYPYPAATSYWKTLTRDERISLIERTGKYNITDKEITLIKSNE